MDGATNSTSTVPAGTNPAAVAVNSVANKIYLANFFGNDVTVIDGATDSFLSMVTVRTGPYAVVVNPVTNKVYVADLISNDVTVVTEQHVQDIPLKASI